MEICLITGTSTGIGQATALHLARRGYKVYATMRKTAKGDKLRAAADQEDLPLVIEPWMSQTTNPLWIASRVSMRPRRGSTF